MCREQRISILTCDLVRFVFALICRSVVCRLSLVKSKPTSKEVLAGIELPEDVGVEMGGGGVGGVESCTYRYTVTTGISVLRRAAMGAILMSD